MGIPHETKEENGQHRSPVALTGRANLLKYNNKNDMNDKNDHLLVVVNRVEYSSIGNDRSDRSHRSLPLISFVEANHG